MITTHRAQDIASALRLAKEFDIKIWLDGAAEAYLLVDEIKAAGVPVIIHPTMQRSIRRSGESELRNRVEAGRRRRSRGAAKRLRSLRAQDASRAVRGGRGRRQRADVRAGAANRSRSTPRKSSASTTASARWKSARTATWPSTTATRSSTRRTASAASSRAASSANRPAEQLTSRRNDHRSKELFGSALGSCLALWRGIENVGRVFRGQSRGQFLFLAGELALCRQIGPLVRIRATRRKAPRRRRHSE